MSEGAACIVNVKGCRNMLYENLERSIAIIRRFASHIQEAQWM